MNKELPETPKPPKWPEGPRRIEEGGGDMNFGAFLLVVVIFLLYSC